MNVSDLNPQSCPHCQHLNPADVSHCEQCDSLLPVSRASGQQEIEQTVLSENSSENSKNSRSMSGEGEPTVIPQLEDIAPPAIAEQTQTAPIAVTLPSSAVEVAVEGDIGAEIDPHRTRSARLQHDSSTHSLTLDPKVFVWRLGKPHKGAYPDLDLSDFPQSEIVSRSHALIRYHRGQYYIEDTNSSNGTYVNHQLLVPGRHYPLYHNDCVAFGKGDLVRFFFQIYAD